MRFEIRRPKRLKAEKRSEEHTSELQSPCNLVCRLLLEKKKITVTATPLDSFGMSPASQTSLPENGTSGITATTRVHGRTDPGENGDGFRAKGTVDLHLD